MPGFTTQRRLAAAELKVGESRVWINSIRRCPEIYPTPLPTRISAPDPGRKHQSQAQEGQQPGQDPGQSREAGLRPLQGTGPQKRRRRSEKTREKSSG